MRQRSAIMAGVIALVFSGGATLAQGQHEHGQKNKPDEAGMMQGSDHMMEMHRMMMRMHMGMMDGDMMDGDMMDRGMMKRGMMDRGHMKMDRAFHKHLDNDEDGKVTPEEARTQLETWLEDYDTNEDGTLSIGEFEALHSQLIRETMVDRFQHLDADGDGQVTRKEMTAPAKKMERMQKRQGMMDPDSDSMRQKHKKGMSDSD